MTLLTITDVDVSAVEDVYEKFSDTLDTLSGLSFEEFLNTAAQFVIEQLPKLGKAALLFIIGRVLIAVLMKSVRYGLKSAKIDPTLHRFLLSVAKMLLYILLGVACLEVLGIRLTPMLTLLGVMGLALSLAVKDTLANMAGGVTLLFSRPFAKGDYVEINSQPGTILELGLVYTQLQTIDNKKIFLPNGDVSKATVVNYSAEPVRRLDLTFPIRDTSDYDKAKQIMLELIAQAPLALKDPAPIVRITDQSYAYVKMTAMVWVKTPDLYELKGHLIGTIRARIAAEKL